MEKIKHSSGKAKLKTRNLFTICWNCVSDTDESDEEDTCYRLNYTPPPPSKITDNNRIFNRKQQMSVTIQEKSLKTRPKLQELDFELKAPMQKLEIKTIKSQNSPSEKVDKDKIVRNILSKYLESKKSLEKSANTSICENECAVGDILDKDSSILETNVKELLSSNFSDEPTIIVATDNEVVNTATEDTSFGTFEQTPSEDDSSKEDIPVSKRKKIELLIQQPSQETINEPTDEDNAGVSLQYKISCEGTPLVTGTLNPGDICPFQRRKSSRQKFTSQELYLQSPHKSENIGDSSASASSLQWKLVFSNNSKK